MAVPETPVNEHNHLLPRNDDIRAAGQVPAVEPESVAHRVKETTDDQLRAGVPRLDRPHVAGSLLGGEYVRHGSRHDGLRILQEAGHVVYLEFPVRRVVFVQPLRDDQGHASLVHLFHLV